MKIAVLGYGGVAKAFCKYIDERDSDFEIKYILRRPGKDIEPRMITDINTILTDNEIMIVVDLLGGLDASYNYMKQALGARKHVVTANKAALCYGFKELTTLADKGKLQLRYEATCGGTVPIVAELISLSRCNEIDSVFGILNGTTNFILYKMFKERAEFGDMLKEAQRLGYAEADPSSDVGGFDVANKISILSATAYRGYITNDYPVYGMDLITKRLMDGFAVTGKTVKYMGISKRHGNRYALGVVPVVVNAGSIEANVPLNYNMGIIHGDNCGDIKLYGQGAGGRPTADAVVRDCHTVLETINVEPQFIFTNELIYDPELLTGTGYIGQEAIRGSLEHLTEIARDRGVALAFEPDDDD